HLTASRKAPTKGEAAKAVVAGKPRVRQGARGQIARVEVREAGAVAGNSASGVEVASDTRMISRDFKPAVAARIEAAAGAYSEIGGVRTTSKHTAAGGLKLRHGVVRVAGTPQD